MKKIFLLILSIYSLTLFSQNTSDDNDIIVDKMCADFASTQNLNDSLRIESLNEKFILPYLKPFSGTDRDEKLDYLFFRLQKRCENFRAYLLKIDPIKGDYWVQLTEKPEFTISENEMNEFKKINKFYYFEYSGEKTQVRTEKKYWMETFSDGTTSKLYYRWIGKNKFELEFIESNNNGRKNFSKVGDKYIYEVINKENGFYWILSQTPSQAEILKFKLFY